jgi:hypothetical protein
LRATRRAWPRSSPRLSRGRIRLRQVRICTSQRLHTIWVGSR